MHGFVTVVPGPYALDYWQSKGYTHNAVGATMPTPPISEFDKSDINKNLRFKSDTVRHARDTSLVFD